MIGNVAFYINDFAIKIIVNNKKKQIIDNDDEIWMLLRPNECVKLHSARYYEIKN